MDKNNKNRTDLLAAGRKRLQQFQKKKDGRGNKSSSKASKSEIESDADSASADKQELLSPQFSDCEGSSINDSDAQNATIPSSEDHTQTISIDDPLSAPVIPETDLDTTSLAHTVELLPDGQVSMKSSVENEQSSDSLASHHVENINVVEKPSNTGSVNMERVISEGDSAHSAILDIDDPSNQYFVETTKSVRAAVDIGCVDGADQVTDIGAIQGGDCLALQQMVKDNEADLEDDIMLGLPRCSETVKTTAGMSKGETKTEEPSVKVSPTIKIIDVPVSSSATNEVKEDLEREGTLVSAQPLLQPFESSIVKKDISIPGSSVNAAKTRSCSQLLLPDSHFIERMKEQLYLATCEKEIYLFQLDEQSKLQFNSDQEHHQLLLEVSSSGISVSEVGQRNESLCEELAKYKSDLEAVVGVKTEIETQFYAAKSEVVDITMRAEGLHVELERSQEASTKQLAEIAEFKTLLAALQAELDTLNGNLTSSVEEKNKLAEEMVFLGHENEQLLTTLVECKDSLKLLQVENANLSDSLLLTSEERRNLEEAKDNIACENDKLLTELKECKALLESLQVENDKLNGNILLATENNKKLAEERSHFAIQSEKLSLELADYKDLLAGMQLEHCKILNELKVEKSRLEQPFEDNTSLLLPRDGKTNLSSAQLKDSEQSFVLIDFKGHLEEAEKLTRLLDNTIEEIHSHSMILSTSSKETLAPVSKLIQSFESKAHHDDCDEEVVSSTNNKMNLESILLAKEQSISLRKVFRELLRDSVNAIEVLKIQENRNLADVSLGDLKVSYEALKEHCDSCEATSVENVVLYVFFKQHWIDIEAQKVELLALYDTIRQHSEYLQAENNKLVSKISVSQSHSVDLEIKMDEMLSSSDELVFSLTNKVDALCKEVAARDLKHDEIINSVRQLGALVGSPCSTLETVHDDLDLVGFVAVSIDVATNFIKNLQENLEACKIDHKTMNSSYMDMVEKCNDFGVKNELFIGVLHYLQSKLKELVTASSGLEEKSQIIEENENLVDPLLLCNFDSLIEQITVLLNERLQLDSDNNKLRSELIDRENYVEELKKRSLDSDAILHLIEDVEGTLKLDGPCFNSDKLESRLHFMISFLFQKYKEADDQLCLSRETSNSHGKELSQLQEKIESLGVLVSQHENEILILKESLGQGREAFVALQAELQGKVNELEQSEQRVSSIREKLSIAVSKGKGLIVQRDSLKQSLAETSSELEKCLQELQSKDFMLEEVETKLKTYSEAGERVEALESELSYIRNSATALRESFILKDSVLQRIEEILEDLELPENYYSRDIIEKVDWLARSVTGNALPYTDWDQKSSGGGGSYTDAGVVSTDAWKENMQQTYSSDNDLRKKYEELQIKFYGLAEQNDMLEQSLMERNNVVQRWEEIIDRVNMPLQLRSMEPEDRIEWLVNALSEAHQHCGSLQQKVDHLETYCTALTADLDKSQMRLADLDTALQAVTSEKEHLLQNLDSSTSNYDRASQLIAKLEFENDKLQNEATVLQEKLSIKVKNYEILNDKLQNEVNALQENLTEEVRRYELIEGEIRRLEDLVSGVLHGFIAGDSVTCSSGTECLEQLLQKLVEQYTTLSLQKTIVSVSKGEHITEEAGAINVENRGKEDIVENNATASREELEEALCALTCVKEERDKYIEINQSLAREVEALDLKRRELQELLSQEEQKSASVREKLNVAVRKGKSLVQHRDSLKQAIEEMNNEVERLKSEIKIQEISHFDYEQKTEDLSTNKKRVEELESENMGLKNLLADTDYFLQEKTHTLSMIVNSLNDFDVSFDNVSDPVEKLKIIAKRWQDLHISMTSSENNFSKAKRSADLLLAELNEVQERNDLLQEELAQVHSEISELSRERDFSEASKQEAISQLEKLSSIHYDERNNQLEELIAMKSCVTELSVSFYSVVDLVSNVLSKEVKHLYNLETSMESSLEPSSAHVGGLRLGDPHSIFPNNSENKEEFLLNNSLLESKMQECIDDNKIAEICGLLRSRLHVFLNEVGVLKEEIYRHTVALDERAKHLSKIAGIVCSKVISQKQSLGSITENSIRLQNIEKERDEESVAMRKNISLLFEACSRSVLEIEKWKSQFVESSLLAEDVQRFDSSIDLLSSEEYCRTLADRLLFSVNDFIRFQTDMVEGGHKDMKVAITNLQKELQEKDIQKERICAEFVNQIREAESAARSHLQDSKSAKSQLDDLKRRLEVIEEERNMLKQRITELEAGESSLKELDERARSLNSVLVAKEQEIEALMHALDEEETQMEDHINKISELERAVHQKNSEVENLEASRAKVMKKLSITVSKFDELHLLSASLLSEVEKLQCQVRERDEEISFLRQEVTRCTNNALLASEMSNKRNSNEMHDLVTWLNSVNSGIEGDVEGVDDLNRDQANDYKELLQKQIGALLSQLEDLRTVVQNKDMLLQVEKMKVEDLMHKEESLENTLREKDSRLRWMESSTSEIVEAEPVINKWSATGTSIAPQVRTLRKTNNDQVAIAIDTNTGTVDKLEDEDDDKAHGFKSLTTSRIVPRFSRPVTDMIDGLWVSCDRTLMRQPALRLGVILYWAVMHALLATFVV